MADNGCSSLSVRMRCMPSLDCWLILLRFFLRVDLVLFRLYDTRFYFQVLASPRLCSIPNNPSIPESNRIDSTRLELRSILLVPSPTAVYCSADDLMSFDHSLRIVQLQSGWSHVLREWSARECTYAAIADAVATEQLPANAITDADALAAAPESLLPVRQTRTHKLLFPNPNPNPKPNPKPSDA